MSLPKTQRSYGYRPTRAWATHHFTVMGKAVIKGVVMSVTPKSGLDLYGAKP